MWTDDYIGWPFLEGGRSRAGIDCLGLYLLLSRERLGREIPDLACTRAEAVRHRLAEAQRAAWQRIAPGAVREGDLVMMRAAGHLAHVGYAIDPEWMLHIESAIGSRLERYDLHPTASRVEGIYRYGAACR
ncbi:NlpC/P60 family protein [Aestuariibius sp. 2305UL40-4]|uniref:NlpC/P60 family protein n=1 Tax=Aestuariibius violaceus TaxID=3234132 RepID=UPI00345EB95C